MSSRPPATDKGTTDRIEADHGDYWVRLVTKQALDREGLSMDNCVGKGDYDEKVGEEEMLSKSIWSLRKASGISYVTLEIEHYRTFSVKSMRGQINHDPARGLGQAAAPPHRCLQGGG